MKGIICFGDSITFGMRQNGGWAGRLKKYFEAKGGHNAVYNLGIPGEGSDGLLKRIDIESGARMRFNRPDNKYIITIAIGANDCKWDGLPEDNKPRMDIKKFEKNIKALIKKTKSYKARVVFIGILPVNEKLTLPYEDTSFKNERIKLFNDVVKKNCKKNGVLFLDLFKIVSKANYVGFLEDGVHPNLKGYDFVFNATKDFLEQKNLL